MTTAKQQTRTTPSRDVDAELGRRAFMLMWDQKRKQGEVAAEMGIRSDSLGRKLKGERGWALAEIVAIASVLGTSVSYLAGETGNSAPAGPGNVTPESNVPHSDYKSAGSVAYMADFRARAAGGMS